MAKKKGGKRKPKMPCIMGILLAVLALGVTSPALAGHLPRPGDMALGASLGSSNQTGEWRTSGGVSFEMWADKTWSYQGSLQIDSDNAPSFYSASAWNYPFGWGATLFGSAGIAAANGTGILADAGAGVEFFPGKSSIQLRGDYFYALDNPGNGDRGSAAFSGAFRWKW